MADAFLLNLYNEYDFELAYFSNKRYFRALGDKTGHVPVLSGQDSNKNIMKTINVALLAGGFSGEYEVSINSAKNIAANLDAEKYKVYTILVNRDAWVYETGDKTIAVDKNDFSLTLEGEKIKFDFAFITVHGTPGEDGKLQGYLDMIGIPYNTCDATTSAITMNKAYTKAIVNGIHGLHTARSIQLHQHDGHDTATIAANLRFPLFIKPNNGGSSVGMSKVHNVAGLQAAIDKAFREDDQILIEEFIKGREFSIGLARLNGKITVLPATEIITTKEFFDYEGQVHTRCIRRNNPQPTCPPKKHRRLPKLLPRFTARLNCRGMVRVDFILLEGTQEVLFY